MQIRYDLTFCFVVRPDASGAGYEFLQLRRNAGDFMGGTWQPVSGQIEAGETPAMAALREMREETGLSALEFYQLSHINTFYIGGFDTMWHCVQFCAIVGAGDAVVLNEEHDEARWMRAEEAAERFMWPGDRQAIREIQSEILGGGLSKPYMKIALPLR